ncbi:hypothetical protein HQ590_02635, partial [bacterium]|nr:hypothetical protein [bacterium]
MNPPPIRSGHLRILVLGYVVRRPFGGQAWHYLQYLLGLRQLGHEVYYLEDSGPRPDCLDPFHERYGPDPTAGLEFLDRTLTAMGLAQHWAYYDQPRDAWSGPCADRIDVLCRSADLLLNVSGLNPLRSWLLDVPRRCLIDTDPVFTQLRHLTCQPADDWSVLWHPDRVRQHTAYFSFGENIGRPNCGVPDDGIRWLPTRQPVVLDAWPVTPPPTPGKFTTVM